MNDNIPKLLNDRGVTAIVVALLMIVFLGIAALAVDIGYNVMVKNQLQNAADAAALAGARQLGEIYKTKNSVTDPEKSNVIQIVKDTASSNKAAGVSVTVTDADIILGDWNPADKTIINVAAPHAVQVNAKNDNIHTFFARIFGKDIVGAKVKATASLSAECSGTPEVPLGISTVWQCNDRIELYPSKSSCAGFTAFSTKWKKNDAVAILQCVLDGGSSCGGNITLPISADFNGGTNEDLLTNPNKTTFEKILAEKGGSWETQAVVYEAGDTPGNCTNPNGLYPIKGFVTLTITKIEQSGEIVADVDCGYSEPERGCGSAFGGIYVYGAIPALVQ
ncbi:MAG: hypothetical protein CVU62_06160 [Deltaproteobacteria bacterium HGW-Deltaproteobacteria-2]|nr:MAG: hypothetical protein CVU62_06160 [Deltaproteobacteria bacterium HGW-Deltaproteobacteria-2]